METVSTKYRLLQPFLEEILGSIRKDIKTDYLPGSTAFYRAHFGNRPLSRLMGEEINAVFMKELLAGNEELSEWVVNRWVFKHGELYSHFAEKLAAIQVDFTSIQSLSLEESRAVLDGAKEIFGAKPIYFFAVLNGVVFPEEIFVELQRDADIAREEHKEKTELENEQQEMAKLIEQQQRQLARLTEKYEQKLAGVLKKYTTDTAALKAQIRALQKK